MTQTEADLTNLIRDNYEITVGLSQPLVPALDLDSLELAELVMLLEERWPHMDEKIAMDETLFRETTIRQLAAQIDAEAA